MIADGERARDGRVRRTTSGSWWALLSTFFFSPLAQGEGGRRDVRSSFFARISCCRPDAYRQMQMQMQMQIDSSSCSINGLLEAAGVSTLWGMSPCLLILRIVCARGNPGSCISRISLARQPVPFLFLSFPRLEQ